MSILKKIMMQRGSLLIAGVFVLIAAIYLASTLPTSGLREPIDNQLEAIRIEDNATAYSYTSLAFQKATSLEAFKRFISHYSSLRNNESISFNKREIKHDIGIVKATLTSRGGIETPAVYSLVKENNRWKIESIIISPQGNDDAPVEAAAAPVATAPTMTPTNEAAAPTPPSTTAATDTAIKTYQDPNHDYSLIYPDEWQYDNSNHDKVIFVGKAGTESSQSTLTIQPLAGKKNADVQSVEEVASIGEAAIRDKSETYKVVEDGLLPPRSNKNDKYHGKYALYTFTVNDQPMKQLQVIYFKSPKRAQYVIDFVAPEAQFETDLPAARAMIASFEIS